MKRPARLQKRKAVSVKYKEKNLWKNWFQFFVIVPVLLICLFTYLFIPVRVHAATGINKQINFQGKLVDNNGLNVADSSYSVVFSLYNTSSGGSAVWTETDSVSTLNGVFQVALGTNTSFPGNVDFNSDTWYLGIKVGADAEMSPRIRFSAVPYAFNAAALDGIVATQSATGFNLAGGTSSYSTVSFTTTGSTLTIQPGDSANGALTIQSNGANGLTLDTGGNGSVLIGNGNATGVTIGRSGQGITLPGFATNNNSVLYTGSAGTLGAATTTSSGLCLTSQGAGAVPIWGSCANAGAASDLTQATKNLSVTTLGSTSTLIGTTFSITPATATGDIWVQANLWTVSASNTDQTITFELRAGADCTGTLLDSEDYVLTQSSGSNGPSGFVSAIATNPGNSSQSYVICGKSTLNTGASAGGFAYATVIDNTGPQGPQGIAGDTLWQLPGLGVLAPKNLTTDVLIGGTSTASATFGFLNVLNGTPTASISAGAQGALLLKADGGLQTTALQPLTLGGGASGDVLIGNNSGLSNVIIQPNAGGDAALIIDKQANLGAINPNLFVASSAGVLKFAVDSGGNATAAGSLSVGQPSSAFTNAVGNFSGNVNNFLQVQVQNKSNGNTASTDFIATADNGTDTTNYIDVGINGSGYNQASFNIGGPDDGYLYTSNGALTIGTASNKPLIFHTNGTTSSNEALRIDAVGKIGAGTVGTNGAGNAQFVVNQTNNSGLGDIFSASAAGTTKFIVHNDGSIQTVGANATADITSITGGNGLTILPKANTSGAGGGLTLKGGNGSGAAGGNVTIDAGTGLTNGTISIGTSNQSGLTLGRSGAISALNGSSITLGAATGVSGALTITSSAATALTVGANGSTNPVLQVDASTGSVATGLKVLGAATGGTTAVSVIDSGPNANLSVDAKGSGTITIGGTSTGSIILGGSTNGLTFSTAAGPSYAGTGRPTKQIVLSAEYAGAVLTASGSAAITGNMTSDASPSAITTTANNYENYYMWTASALGSDQQYTVAVRVTLPKDFSDWATGNAITVDFNTPFTNSALNSLDVFIYKGGDTTGRAVAFSKSNVSGTSKNWTQVAFTKTQLTSVAPTLTAAGQVAVFYLTFHSTNTVNYVQVGDITLNYLAGF